MIAVADRLKPGAAEAVARLHAMGLQIVMLTGDTERTAQVIARQAGIGDVLVTISHCRAYATATAIAVGLVE